MTISTTTAKICIQSIRLVLLGVNCLANRPFQRDAEELLGFDGKLHGEFLQHLFGIAVDDEADGLLGGNATLVAVEELVLGDLRSRCLMLKDGGVVVDVHIGEGVGTAVGA